MSPTPDRTLDDLQQTIADLKRQLAESNAERDEGLRREAASADVLQVINSSPGDLAPVFDAMLDKALQLCGAAFGILHTIDGERRHIAAHRGVSPTFSEFLTGRPHEFAKTGWLIGQLLRGERFIHHDVTESEGYRSGAPIARALVEIEGARTALAVPLSKDNALLGLVYIYRREVRPFSDKQIALLQNFAAQAVIAMENARLINETREALEQQTATTEVLQVINSSPGDLAPVFDAMLEKAMRLCEAACGHLYTYDGDRFHPIAVRGEAHFVEWWRQNGPIRPLPDGLAPLGRVARGERIVGVDDFREDAAYRTIPAFRATVDASNTRSGVTVALRNDVALLGAITIYRQEVRPFTDKQIALLQNFAAQAVIAMENARLITETREALEQQTATAEVLQVINSSPGDLGPVFDAMLEKAMNLCGAAFGALMSYDGERVSAVATRGLPPQLVDVFRQPVAPRRDGDAPYARFLRGESLLHIIDMAADDVLPSLASRPRALVEIGGARTGLEIPLRQEGAVLGSIWLYRQEVRSFTDKQIALLQNFAAQAIIAMENARLITETREALEQQTATAEVLGVINASPGDLAPVFDAILEKAHSLCGVSSGALLVRDGEGFQVVAAHGASDYYNDRILHGSFHPPEGTPLWRVLHGEPLIHLADARADDSYRKAPAYAQRVDSGGIRTLLQLPLRKDGEVLGVITAFRCEVRPFTDKEIALLQNFAAQAVIAMENARLITETREALEQQTATAEVLGVINSSPGDLAPVFEAMLEKMLRLCEAAHGNFLTYDGEVFHLAAFRDAPQFAEYRRHQGPQRPAESGQLARMVQGGGTLHRIDARESEAYRDDPGFRRMVDGLGIRTSLAVPLRKGDALLGVVRAYRLEVRPFTDKQIALVENFAAQAVIAMENARLLGELRQRTEEVGELNRDLEARVAEQVDELGRVGRLKRFLAPQLAELIVSQGDEKILESHRREIVVVFCDLRGYTAFTETAEPEEVLDFLREYHGALGPLVSQFEGTLDQFSGDGIMVFFNDPVPCPDPAERAVKMAMAMREVAGTLIAAWRRRGRMLGFGAGIAQGYATLGQIGFSERSGYTAIGTVCNVAARLCAEAKDGQILVAQRVAVAVEERVPLEEVGELTVKGLTQPVVAYNVPLAAIQPALRVIEGGSPDRLRARAVGHSCRKTTRSDETKWDSYVA